MKIVLSRRQRWNLAGLFCHQDLKLADLAEMKAYNRARLALRLGPMQQIHMARGRVLVAMIQDDTAHAFDLETASAAFVSNKIVPLIVGDLVLAMLFDGFPEALEVGGASPEALKGASPLAEPEVWAGPAEPPQPTYEDLRAFLGCDEKTPRVDVLARAEALCAPTAETPPEAPTARSSSLD